MTQMEQLQTKMTKTKVCETKHVAKSLNNIFDNTKSRSQSTSKSSLQSLETLDQSEELDKDVEGGRGGQGELSESQRYVKMIQQLTAYLPEHLLKTAEDQIRKMSNTEEIMKVRLYPALLLIYLFHHPHHQWAEKVKFRAENVFLLPGTSFGQ